MRRFERPVMSLIARMVRDPVTAEDLAQETFVKAFRNLHRYDPQKKLASWLFKIAHNTTLDHLRKRSLDTVPLESSAASGEETWEVVPAPETASPQRRAESVEILAGLEKALARLRPNYREILLLRFREGLAYHEIAEVIDLPMGTVKIQLHRARKRLAAELERLGLAPRGSPETGAARPAKEAGRGGKVKSAKQAVPKPRRVSTKEARDGRKRS